VSYGTFEELSSGPPIFPPTISSLYSIAGNLGWKRASRTVDVNKNIIKYLHLFSNIKNIYIYDFIKIFKGPFRNELSLSIN